MTKLEHPQILDFGHFNKILYSRQAIWQSSKVPILGNVQIKFLTNVSKSAHICAADHTIPSFAAYQFSVCLLQNWPKLRGNEFPIFQI